MKTAYWRYLRLKITHMGQYVSVTTDCFVLMQQEMQDIVKLQFCIWAQIAEFDLYLKDKIAPVGLKSAHQSHKLQGTWTKH